MNSFLTRLSIITLIFFSTQSVSHAGVFGWLGDAFKKGEDITRDIKGKPPRNQQKQDININVKPNYTGPLLISVAAGISIGSVLKAHGIEQIPEDPVESELKEELANNGKAQVWLCDSPEGKPFAIKGSYDNCPWANSPIYRGPNLN